MHVKVATMADDAADHVDDFSDDGWDMRATLVDGRWVDRSPRRADVVPQVRREVAVMPWLAPQLPLPVPVPRVVSEDPLVVRHAYVSGVPCPGASAAHGRAVGEFLLALHAVDPAAAVDQGARDAAASFAAAQEVRDRMQEDVLPLLPSRVRAQGEALLRRMSVPPPAPRLVHGDLGPTHVLVVGDRVSGIIDWGDCCVGDPALDLAWTRFGAGPTFAQALDAAYDPADDVLARGRDWHLLGPWHEVVFGLESGRPGYVDSGLEGAVSRLEAT
jgi:aminoglycoside phosphotransferase (APT) family kinase protein